MLPIPRRSRTAACALLIALVTLLGCSTEAERGAPPPVAGERLSVAPMAAPGDFNTEAYADINENRFHSVAQNPLSTFSIDVDTASYSNVRRFLTEGSLPPADAVRVEELINYFQYDYPEPKGDEPFAVTAELASCPWQPSHKLAQIGINTKAPDLSKLPAHNLVFLLDVSGSMAEGNKLPLLKRAFALSVEQLRPQDRVAIVVYAGAAGIVLPPTPGSSQGEILAALGRLEAGGSTAGGEGIALAYRLAREHFVEGGNNRVILATDGDFNVGPSSDGEMVDLIEKNRDSGVFLTVLGFGRGNLKDSKMESLADRGNGNYAYIDNLLEARKVLVEELGGTLFTVAKDVKIQVEFNPAKVESYRLIGYENRLLREEDFEDDKVDAGEIGAGHSVTAFYEIVPAGGSGAGAKDGLKYQTSELKPDAKNSKEALTVSIRYKQPTGDTSQLMSHVVVDSDAGFENASQNLRFASAVAEMGMLLRESEHKGTATYDQMIALAEGSRGEDRSGRKSEFIYLAKTARGLAGGQRSTRLGEP